MTAIYLILGGILFPLGAVGNDVIDGNRKKILDISQNISQARRENDDRKLGQQLMARMATYEADVAARRAQAGPLQPFLSEYFDAIPLLGEYVRASYSDGRVAALGHFVGIDIWDRVTVRDKAGTEHEFAQEQASLRPLPQD
jgi:hypothetical protein